MQERLPDRVDPFRLAQRGAVLTGELPLAGMNRLAASLVETDGKVAVELRFGRDQRGIAVVGVSLRAELVLECQNCLAPCRHPIAVDTLVGVVASEAEAERLPAAYEPHVVGDSPLAVSDLVEDELILALPVIARHPGGECLARGEPSDGGQTATNERNGRGNPFAVLEQLKKNGKS